MSLEEVPDQLGCWKICRGRIVTLSYARPWPGVPSVGDELDCCGLAVPIRHALHVRCDLQCFRRARATVRMCPFLHDGNGARIVPQYKNPPASERYERVRPPVKLHDGNRPTILRSEEHTSELQSLR